MKQPISKQEVPFTQVANSVINDPNISLRDKGVFVYIYSKPDGWNYAAERISEVSTDGKYSVRASLRALEEAGYITRNKTKNGTVQFTISYDKNMAINKHTAI